MSNPTKEFSSIAAGLPGIRQISGALGRGLTTFSIGGPIPNFVEVKSREDLKALLKDLRTISLPVRVIGGGSNLLIADHGVRDCVVRLGKEFRYVNKISSTSGSCFRVGGAVSVMNLSREMAQSGYSGLEFAGGIPAWIGGAVRMNAGAHKSEMASVLREIEFFDKEGKVHRINRSEVEFSYRSCSLPPGSIVTEVTIELIAGDASVIERTRSEFFSYRRSTQPLQYPSAGSVFKNPYPDSAGAILDSCSLKGHSIGQAKVSDLHANWIINPNKEASFKDVLELIAHCQSVAKEKRGVSLDPELVVWTG